jgi:hypothetical protein
VQQVLTEQTALKV